MTDVQSIAGIVDTLEGIKKLLEIRIPDPRSDEEISEDRKDTVEHYKWVLKDREERDRIERAAIRTRLEKETERTKDFLRQYHLLGPAGRLAFIADTRFIEAEDSTVSVERLKIKFEVYELLEQAARYDLAMASNSESKMPKVQIYVDFDARQINVIGVPREEFIVFSISPYDTEKTSETPANKGATSVGVSTAETESRA